MRPYELEIEEIRVTRMKMSTGVQNKNKIGKFLTQAATYLVCQFPWYLWMSKRNREDWFAKKLQQALLLNQMLSRFRSQTLRERILFHHPNRVANRLLLASSATWLQISWSKP